MKRLPPSTDRQVPFPTLSRSVLVSWIRLSRHPFYWRPEVIHLSVPPWAHCVVRTRAPNQTLGSSMGPATVRGVPSVRSVGMAQHPVGRGEQLTRHHDPRELGAFPLGDALIEVLEASGSYRCADRRLD